MIPVSQITRLWLNRILWFVVVVAGLALLLHLPAGVSYVEAGQRIEGLRVVNEYRREFSFDRVLQELKHYPADLVTGKIVLKSDPNAIGFSFTPVLKHDWLNSFKLYGASVGVGSVLGVLVGVLMVLRGRLVKSASLTFSVLGLSMPDFFVVMTLQFLSTWFWLRYDWKPFLVLADPNVPKGWIVPLIGMALVPLGYTARLTASAMDDVMQEEYIRTARSKGLHEYRVLLGHAFRNALPRVLAGLPALLNVTLSSLPVVERFTVWPGISKWLIPQGGFINGKLYGVTPAIATTAALVLVAWFVLFDAVAHTVRIIFSPKQPEVARA